MEHLPSDPLPGFATRLRALRLERGLSQEALAAVVAFAPIMFYRISYFSIVLSSKA